MATPRAHAVARLLRRAAGPLVVAVVVWRIGAGPVVDGFRSVTAPSLLVALLLGLVATACCTWRWHLVARGLEVHVPAGSGMEAYYRSQFLNSVLPGGVLGDVHRALHHGRDSGDTGAALRAVVWERTAGQVVQVVLTVLVLCVLPSPARAVVPAAAWLAVGAVVVAVLVHRVALSGGAAWWARGAASLGSDVRDVLLRARVWPGVVLASCVVVLCHVASFVVAARTAGSTAPIAQLVPLALVVLLGMAVPVSVAGWGPREGVAAWAFAAAGLTAGLGVAACVVYAVMVAVATLPGLVVLVFRSGHRTSGRDDAVRPGRQWVLAAPVGGSSRG